MKTSSNRRKETIEFETKRRQIDWKFVMAFLIGSIFGEITADPSNIIYFWRMTNGVEMTPAELTFYRYYLPAIFYAIFFTIAIILMRYTNASPTHYVYIIFLAGGVGTFFSLVVLGFDPLVVLLLVVPVISVAMYVFYEVIVKVNGRDVST